MLQRDGNQLLPCSCRPRIAREISFLVPLATSCPIEGPLLLQLRCFVYLTPHHSNRGVFAFYKLLFPPLVLLSFLPSSPPNGFFLVVNPTTTQ